MGSGDSFSGHFESTGTESDALSIAGLVSLLLRFDSKRMVCAGNLRLTYVELHARSAFSFLEGASLPEELVSVCKEYGMQGMALLDRDGVYGSPRFYLAAEKQSITAHIGAEVT